MDGDRLTDDTSIPDDAELWRRICPRWVVPDDNGGGLRVSSAAFDNSNDGSPTSVLLAEIVEATDRAPSDVLTGFEGYGLAAVTAGQARGCQQGVARDPLPEEPAHAFVFGKKTKRAKRCLAKKAKWVIWPWTER